MNASLRFFFFCAFASSLAADSTAFAYGVSLSSASLRAFGHVSCSIYHRDGWVKSFSREKSKLGKAFFVSSEKALGAKEQEKLMPSVISGQTMNLIFALFGWLSKSNSAVCSVRKSGDTNTVWTF